MTIYWFLGGICSEGAEKGTGLACFKYLREGDSGHDGRGAGKAGVNFISPRTQAYTTLSSFKASLGLKRFM